MNRMVFGGEDLDDWERMIRYAENVDVTWQTARVKKINPAVWAWIEDNCTGRIKNWGTYFFFESESDRTAFTLVWL